MTNDTDEQDEVTQALLSMQGKVAPRSMSPEFIKEHFDAAPSPATQYSRGNEGLIPNIDWKARAKAAEAALAACRQAVAEAEKMFRWYGDLHAAKEQTPENADKTKRNYDMADKMARTLKTKEPTNG